MKQLPTIREIARHASVSVGTVSRVLNGHANVGEETLRRVNEALAKLNYDVDSPAMSNRRGGGGSRRRTGNIGVLLTGMGAGWADHPLFAAYTSGVAEACREHQYNPLLDFADAATDNGVPQFLADQKVDGLLLKGGYALPAWLDRVARTLPVVGMAMHEPGLSIPQVMPDNRSAGWQMAEYLWKRGHRQIAFVCNDARHRMFLHRLQGVQEFLRLHRAYDPTLMIVDDPIDAPPVSRPEAALPDMARQFESLWARPAERRPTAIVAANDWTAAGVHLALERQGLSVPGDVSLAGFDNEQVVCCSLRTPLTSYAVPIRQCGYVAAKILLRQIETPKAYVGEGIQLIAGRLVERQSVANVATVGLDGELDSSSTAAAAVLA